MTTYILNILLAYDCYVKPLHNSNDMFMMINMQNMDATLDHFDLRALRLLALILELKSVTRAGEALGLSQPAASRVLASLRRALGNDPLIVRAGATHVLTPRAQAIAPLISSAIDSFRHVFAPSTFDPASASLMLRVATTDYGAAVVVTMLAKSLAAKAPGITIEVVPWGPDTLLSLGDGSVDLALYAEDELPGDFRWHELFREDYVCLVRSGHPVLSQCHGDGRMAPELLCRLPRAVMQYPHGRNMLIDDLLADLGTAENQIVFQTPYFMSGPLAVAQTDCVICLPRRIAELMVGLVNLRMIELPQRQDFGYRLIWHKRTENDLALTWVRKAAIDMLI